VLNFNSQGIHACITIHALYVLYYIHANTFKMT